MQDGGGMMGSAFSSPVFATLGGQRQLVVQSREKLAGLDPADGKVLWQQEVKAFRGMNILTPITHGDAVFTSTYGGKTVLYGITNDHGNFRVSERWVEKAQGYMSTPVVIAGYAYQHTKSQRFRCLDLATGAEKWMTDRSFGKYWSLVAQGDRILALDEKGVVYLIRATPEKFELLGEAKVSKEESWAHLAVVGDQLFVRDLAGLTVLRWQ
jgi:outer membrane protein assembly factor BamB